MYEILPNNQFKTHQRFTIFGWRVAQKCQRTHIIHFIQHLFCRSFFEGGGARGRALSGIFHYSFFSFNPSLNHQHVYCVENNYTKKVNWTMQFVAELGYIMCTQENIAIFLIFILNRLFDGGVCKFSEITCLQI